MDFTEIPQIELPCVDTVLLRFSVLTMLTSNGLYEWLHVPQGAAADPLLVPHRCVTCHARCQQYLSTPIHPSSVCVSPS